MSTNNLENSKACTRFEEHGLLLLERGQPLDEHYHTCSDCIEAKRVYQALGNLVATAVTSSPKDGWQDAVLDEIHGVENLDSANQAPSTSISYGSTKSSRPWFGAIAAGVAVLGVASLFMFDSLFVQNPNDGFQASGLELSVIASGETYRGSEAKVGDQLALHTVLAEPDDIALRLYRDGKLYFSCGQGQACQFKQKSLAQTVELTALGEYQAVIYLDKKLTQTPSENIDFDVLVSMDAGGDVIISDTVIVR